MPPRSGRPSTRFVEIELSIRIETQPVPYIALYSFNSCKRFCTLLVVYTANTSGWAVRNLIRTTCVDRREAGHALALRARAEGEFQVSRSSYSFFLLLKCEDFGRSIFYLKVPHRELRNWGGTGFPPHFSICSNFAGSCPIELKIELCTDQEHSSPFPGCFCDSTIFGTPLAQFSSQGGPKIYKSSKTPFHSGIFGVSGPENVCYACYSGRRTF